MFGLMEERVPGRSVLEIIRNDALSDFISTLLRDSGAVQSREIRITGAEGERVFAVQASTILEDTGRLLLMVFHDITGFKRLEQMRRDFVANVSHELRTPLTALVGSTEVLLDGMYRKPEESRKFLEIMDKQLHSIQNLVSDMLRLAAVEDSRTPFRKEEISASDLVDDVLAPIRPLATKKHQELKVVLPPDELILNIDVAQLSAAVTNLLDNAVKYTQEGGSIELNVHPQNGGVRIEVRDNGPGIPREQLPRIFERFYRVDKSRSKEMGGTGLGLAITRHAVENHGGIISVQSELGRWTLFIIQLPDSCLASPVSKV
jgi:two-component system phosphate regulon sensor histidine kinase PhoR